MTINDPVEVVKGVGGELSKKFAKLGIKTVEDLVSHYPRKYNDYSKVTAINKLKTGLVTIEASITQVKGRYIRGGLHITEAIASDKTGSVRIVWFNQPYRAQAIKPSEQYYISGTFELKARRLSIMNPSMELVSNFPINTARLVPIYSETKGLTSWAIRKVVKAALEALEITEVLPLKLVKTHKLISRDTAVRLMHFPKTMDDIEKATWRLGFEEVFCLVLASLQNKRENAKEEALPIPFEQQLAVKFVSHLPFKLTDGQRKVVWDIYQDMTQKRPMNRLVEGDVGSGKTVVAAMAALMAINHGYQVAYMAPTELLARQHAETIYKLLKPLGYSDDVLLLVGAMSASQKAQAQTNAQTGVAKLLIGTHALIQETINLHNLGMVIIDEQHRFGVEQRKKLLAKAGHMPHLLSMTATPIPRTLALTLFGEMDISRLTQMPKDRLPIKTQLIAPTERPKLYQQLEQQLKSGRQIFVVCPVITATDTFKNKSVEEVYEVINKQFANYRVDLLHGRMKSEDKQKIMQEFVDHKLDILVSTTVIEVGVDVPNASVMLIEAPEHFGLAQIHQLRGRVGRSTHQSYCYLLLSEDGQVSKRLEAVTHSNDGFSLAELDLRLRGPGAIYGTFQHGELDLRIADLTDAKLITAARSAAQEFMEAKDNLLQYKELHERVKRLRSVVHLN